MFFSQAAGSTTKGEVFCCGLFSLSSSQCACAEVRNVFPLNIYLYSHFLKEENSLACAFDHYQDAKLCVFHMCAPRTEISKGNLYFIPSFFLSEILGRSPRTGTAAALALAHSAPTICFFPLCFRSSPGSAATAGTDEASKMNIFSLFLQDSFRN